MSSNIANQNELLKKLVHGYKTELCNAVTFYENEKELLNESCQSYKGQIEQLEKKNKRAFEEIGRLQKEKNENKEDLKVIVLRRSLNQMRLENEQMKRVLEEKQNDEAFEVQLLELKIKKMQIEKEEQNLKHLREMEQLKKEFEKMKNEKEEAEKDRDEFKEKLEAANKLIDQQKLEDTKYGENDEETPVNVVESSPSGNSEFPPFHYTSMGNPTLLNAEASECSPLEQKETMEEYKTMRDLNGSIFNADLYVVEEHKASPAPEEKKSEEAEVGGWNPMDNRLEKTIRLIIYIN